MATLDGDPEMEFDTTFKILLLGDSGVGKTCLIFRFTEDVFSDSYISTIGIDCRSRVVELDGRRVRLQIWDTAGQERFRTLTSAYYRGAMGILLVYDLTTEDSFKHIANWLQNIEENASSDVCKALVGNKVDADDERVIDFQRGKSISDNANLEFFETSARSGENVNEAFMAVARQISAAREQKGMRFQYQDGFTPLTAEDLDSQPKGCCRS